MKKIYFSHLLPGVTEGVLSYPQPGLIPDVFYAVEEHYMGDAPDLDTFIQAELKDLNKSNNCRWILVDEKMEEIDQVKIACLPHVPIQVLRGMYEDADIWVAFYVKELEDHYYVLFSCNPALPCCCSIESHTKETEASLVK